MLKKVFIMLIVCAGLILVFSAIDKKAANLKVPKNVVVKTISEDIIKPTTTRLCFYKQTPTNSDLYDTSWAILDLVEEKVTGEFYYLPAEKDGKFGEFEGSVGPVDPYMMARVADLWWNWNAEGMSGVEQLQIVFGEGTAQAGFGEMIDRGDGVFIYKDINNLYFSEEMFDVDCKVLYDKFSTE